MLILKNIMCYTGRMKSNTSRKAISIVVGAVIAVMVVTGVAIVLISRWLNAPTYPAKVCTSMNLDMQCERYETKEIVRGTEDDPQLCEQHGEAIYESVGGIVGMKYVGCTP